MESKTFKGVVHGRTIELERAPDLPDGQEVLISVQPRNGAAALPSVASGLRKAFGGWADAAEHVDQFVKDARDLREAGSRADGEP